MLDAVTLLQAAELKDGDTARTDFANEKRHYVATSPPNVVWRCREIYSFYEMIKKCCFSYKAHYCSFLLLKRGKLITAS